MCNLMENFMEEALFFQQIKLENEHRMWCEFVEQKEAEEQAYLSQAEQHFKDLEKYETSLLQKEYRKIQEWDELQTI